MSHADLAIVANAPATCAVTSLIERPYEENFRRIFACLDQLRRLNYEEVDLLSEKCHRLLNEMDAEHRLRENLRRAQETLAEAERMQACACSLLDDPRCELDQLTAPEVLQ